VICRTTPSHPVHAALKAQQSPWSPITTAAVLDTHLPRPPSNIVVVVKIVVSIIIIIIITHIVDDSSVVGRLTAVQHGDVGAGYLQS